ITVERVPAPRRRRNRNFDFAAKRRREIVLHARYVGAAQTDDFDRWLIAWVWRNGKAKDRVGRVWECARNMAESPTRPKHLRSPKKRRSRASTCRPTIWPSS